jgi:hypothetical protein
MTVELLTVKWQLLLALCGESHLIEVRRCHVGLLKCRE